MNNAFLASLLLITGGCLQPPAAHPEGAPQWTASADLKVTHEATGPQFETIVLVDLSASNTFRGPMFAEVEALVATIPDQEEVCVLQISEDSRATTSAPWCRGAMDTFVCIHDPVKTTGFANATKEKPAYQAAAARIEREMKACEAERKAEVVSRKASGKAGLKAWIKDARTTQWTDIQGALARARSMSALTPGVVWIYSDMEDDPDPRYKRAADLTVDLAEWMVKVRQIRKSGAGYDTTWQTKWTGLFGGWGDPAVEWQDFRQGEFSDALKEILLIQETDATGTAKPTATARQAGAPLFADKPGAHK